MEKGEKASPTPSTQNIFDAASLLGASPFAAGLSTLPFGHLAHLPGAFSMLGHPAFPVSSLFGRLGDGLTSPLGSPASLTSGLNSSSGSTDPAISPAIFTLGQAVPISDTSVLLTVTSGNSTVEDIKHGLFSSPSFSKSAEDPPSKSAKTSSVSRPTKPSPSSSAQKSSLIGSKQKLPGARGRPRKLTKQPPIPLSLVSGTSILSPSQLEKFMKKGDASATNGLDESSSKEKSPTSKASHNGHAVQKKVGHRGRPSQKSTNTMSLLQDSVHIDSLKKKLIADQIRQRMQNKASASGSTAAKKRGRGRPPKISKDLSPKEAEAQKKKQEELKVQLEAELKQQQIALRMLKKANSMQKDSASVKTNSSLKEKAGALHKANTSPKEPNSNSKDTCPKLFSKANAVHKEVDSEAKRAVTSSKETDHVTERATSPVKCDGKQVKHIGLLNLVRQRSPEGKALQSPTSSSDKEETGAQKPEPLVAKFKKTDDKASNVSSAGDSDSSESSGSSDSSSSSSSDSSDEDESKSESGSTSSKRPASDNTEGQRPIKRRCVILDESHLRVPLSHGWKRQTHIHTYGRRGIVGEVWYFAPCGRKMKTIPDVMRYLERNSITDFGRDNFSFNTKVNVGEFYENRSGGENGYVKLSASEIDDRLAVTLSRRQKKIENQKKQEKINLQQQMAKRMMEAKMKQKLQDQEMARKVAEMQFKKRLEKQQQKELFKRAKQMKILEKRKQKEEQRLLRERERLQKEEQSRMKRDVRMQQILEKKREKARAIEQRRDLKAVKKAEERELKRQQTAMLKEQMRLKQEQERQRQHILLLKALEQRKKLEVSRLRAEDRERQREEKMVERRINKEKKVEQRRLEYVLAMELKKPREDMELRDSKVMPEFERIKGCVLDGEAFADCLMSLEFLHNFAAALGFDNETLPTMKGLQDAVTSKTEEDGEEYLSLVSHLLRYALDDPGVPNPKEAVTRLGQKIVDIEVTDAILPEVLRVFMVARNGKETELSEYLKTRPLEACSVTQRASVLAFLCNELNCSKNITTEIERNLDHMGDIRRDKWVVEGKLRRLRLLIGKKFNHPVPKPVGDGDSSIADGEDSMTSTAMTSKQNSEDEDGSGNESDGGGKDESFNDSDSVNEEDDPTTLEDCEKQMEKLQKQHAQYRDKVFDASHKVRAIILGQDRYKRTFWVLPCAGGVYVEGMESGEFTYIPEQQKRAKDKINVKAEPDIGKSALDKEVDKKLSNTEIKSESNSDKGDSSIVLSGSPEIKVKVNSDGSWKPNEIKEETNNIDPNIGQNRTENSTSDENKMPVSVLDSSESKGSEKHNPIPDGETVVDKPGTLAKEATHSDKIPPQSVSVSGNDTQIKCSSKNVELKIPSIKPCAISSHDNMNLFLQVPSSTKLSDFCNFSSSADTKTVSSNNLIMSSLTPSYISSTHMAGGHVMSPASHISASLPSPPKPPPAHSSKHTSETKASFMSIDSILKKEPETSQTNQFFGVSISPFTNTLLKGISDTSTPDGKPWFSILPRVPCDDMSLTRGQHQSFSAGMFTSPPYISQISSFRSFPVPSPTFSSFQMGQILGNSSSYSLPGTPSSSGMSTPVLGADPFKVPDVPSRSCQTPDPEDLLKNLQGEAKPIPEEFQKGWWKISEPDQVRQLQRCLHPRGIREKNLHKTIQKFSEYTFKSCTKGKKEVISLESSDSESEEEKESETKTSDESQAEASAASPKGEEKDDKKENKQDDKKEKKKRKKETVSVIDCKEKSHEADMIALEEVHTMEDRIASASLQIKGWKLAPKIGSEESEIKIIPRWQTKTSEEEQYPLEIAIERLLQVESNIERRYLKPPLCKVQKINVNSVSTNHENDDRYDQPETVLPAGLQTWRAAVATATSPAQIMLCIIQLNNAISWEKSIMKVLCQICRKDDNEAQLLLCDGCDRGYHTYCFKPKMESVPEGDWYCFECISKAVGESCCLVCGRRFGKMAECYSCPRAVHLDCLDPPLPRIPRKWFCAACEDERGVKRRPRKNSTASTTSNSTTPSISPRKNSTSTPATTTSSNSATPASNATTPVQQNNLTPTGRKRRCDAGIPRKKKNSEAESPEKKEEKTSVPTREPLPGEESSDMVMCRLILMEMEKHEDGWPFLQPVNCKQFTSYRKFIKNPMDFSTMKQKLRDNSYKTRGDFAADAQLVFDNCKTFNEDESEVGHCGHVMRKFFNKRWKELLSASADDETDEASPS